LKFEISDLKFAISNLQSQICNLKSAISNLQSQNLKISALKISALKSDIAIQPRALNGQGVANFAVWGDGASAQETAASVPGTGPIGLRLAESGVLCSGWSGCGRVL
jgi:hypothetical protein